MRNRDLIKKLEESMPEWKNGMHAGYINTFLSDLRNQPSDTLVQVNNGKCQYDGIYAPVKKDGKMYPEKAKAFKAGQAFPSDDYDWVRVG